jgi:hypothetical protein
MQALAIPVSESLAFPHFLHIFISRLPIWTQNAEKSSFGVILDYVEWGNAWDKQSGFSYTR